MSEESEKLLEQDLAKALAIDVAGIDPAKAAAANEAAKAAFPPLRIASKTELSLSDQLSKLEDISSQFRAKLRRAVAEATMDYRRQREAIYKDFTGRIDTEVARLEDARDNELKLALRQLHERLRELAELQGRMDL
jgi:hypothetical protein